MKYSLGIYEMNPCFYKIKNQALLIKNQDVSQHF